MAVYEGKFIVEGRHYEWLPAEFKKSPEFGVRKQTFPTLDLKNITVVQQAPTTADTYLENRKVHRQAWQVSWDESAPLSLEMRDHLMNLYTLQKEVWVQFDDEQSRDGCILETVGTDYKAYFTPTYPIMPYGHSPLDPREYNGTVFVNNVPKYTGFDVDSEVGMVRFTNALTANDVVQMAYSWKARVRVDMCDISAGFRLARHMYVGSIVLVQTIPVYTTDPFPVTMPWEQSIDAITLDERLGICIASGDSGSSGSSHNSHATVDWPDARYA
jgi:hypothetical protein